jgi:hypothetical protein
MARADRTDADAAVVADANGSPPVPGGTGSEAHDERRPQQTTSPPSPPAGADESGAIALGPMSTSTHELLEQQPNGDDRPPAKPHSASPQLVSGDPLLRGPAPTAKVEPSPKPSRPPPPPDTRHDRPTTTSERPAAPSDPGNYLPGVTGPATGQPARRASRGAHVAPARPAAPPERPPEQPVATLRPTTVAPVPRLAGRRPRVRRVTRVVRHVDPWSVFKVAAAFSIVAYAIALIAGVLLWNVAYATGTIDNIERGMESTGWEVFELDGGEIFHNAWIGGLFAAVGLTGLAVLVATLFNLITDIVGGVRLTVLEEEVVEKTSSPMRRFATASVKRQGPPAATTVPPTAQGAEARVRRAREA